MAAAAAARKAYLPPPEEDRLLGGMPILEHLDELRMRVIRALAGVAACTALAFLFIVPIRDFVMQPTLAALPPGATIIFTNPVEGFSVYLQIAFIAGSVLAAPVVMFQIWRFIEPGLHANERRFAIPFVALSSGGLVAGAAFSHYIAFPATIAFLASFSDPRFAVFTPRLQDVFGTYLRLLLGMALAFQMPPVVYLLARMRLVTARWLLRRFKYAVLLIAVAAAVLTPSPDPFNQALYAAPMLGLYMLSIGVAWLANR